MRLSATCLLVLELDGGNCWNSSSMQHAEHSCKRPVHCSRGRMGTWLYSMACSMGSDSGAECHVQRIRLH